MDGPSAIASVADMNNDNLPDLIVQTGDVVTPSTITILLADAAGNYATNGQVNSSVFFPFPCVPADLNGDNKMDLVCASSTPGGGVANVSVYLGNGDGTLQSPISNSLGYIGVPNALFDVIAVGDFNNDRHPDLIVTSALRVHMPVTASLCLATEPDTSPCTRFRATCILAGLPWRT